MDRLIEIEDHLREIHKGFDNLVIETARTFDPDIVAYNRDDQLYDQGIDSTGKKITPRYTPYTRQLKGLKGQPTNRVTLKDTGAFHRSISVTYNKKSFRIKATDSKRRKLEQKYGEEILGLTEASIEKLREKVVPIVVDEITKPFQ